MSLAAVLALGVSAAALAMPAQADTTVDSQSGPIQVQTLAKLDNPWGMAFLPGGRLLITEKRGQIRVFADGKLSDPIANVPTVAYLGQGGLLDIEVDPNFAQNQFVYIYYAEAVQPQPQGANDPWDKRLGDQEEPDNTVKAGAVARARLDGMALADVKVIWRQEPAEVGRGHFGGRLAFAPDGKLLITSGDRQRFDPAQDMNSNLGKVVRINSDGSMPDDNPFAKGGGRRDIYSAGHRNPLGIAIHPTSGAIWVNEMGPKGGDELNLIAPGKNYGWPAVSNGSNYDDSPIPAHGTQPNFVAPVVSWTPVISPSGMAFYTGTLFPTWQGSALIGGLSSEALIRVTLNGDAVAGEERLDMGERIRDVAQAPDGAILVLTDGDGGELWRLTPGAKQP